MLLLRDAVEVAVAAVVTVTVVLAVAAVAVGLAHRRRGPDPTSANLTAVLVEKKAGSTPPPENPPLPLPPEMQMVPSFGYEQWDTKRSARACSWRALIWAPVAHYFWLGLETYVSPMVAHLGHRGTLIKVVLDFW